MVRRLLLTYLVIIAFILALLPFTIRPAQAAPNSLANERLPLVLADYYATRNSWADIQPELQRLSLLLNSPLSLADANGQIIATTNGIAPESPELATPIKTANNLIIGTLYVQNLPVLPKSDNGETASALLTIALFVALLALISGVIMMRSASRSLTEMRLAAGRIAQGDYSVRVRRQGRDEIAALTAAFNQMAEKVNSVERLRRELVANVSHDLRTPLTIIRGYLEGLRSHQIADRRSAEMAFDSMYGEVSRLLTLVQNLQQVTVLDSGKFSLPHPLVKLAELAQKSIERVAPLAQAHGVALVTEVADNLPPIQADSAALQQALFNLLENAVYHTPPDGIITLAANHGNGCITLTVRDTGEGIAPEHLPHIFERFYRADPARSRQANRTGLGLAIVAGIVRAHNGQVCAASDGIPGHGSTFTIKLPL